MTDDTDIRVHLATLMADVKMVQADVSEIKTQTQATNGRVNRQDVQIAFIKGVLAVITFLIPVAVAAAYLFK